MLLTGENILYLYNIIVAFKTVVLYQDFEKQMACFKNCILLLQNQLYSVAKISCYMENI